MIRGRDCNPRNNRFLSRKMFGRIVWKWLPGSPLFVFGGVSGGGCVEILLLSFYQIIISLSPELQDHPPDRQLLFQWSCQVWTPTLQPVLLLKNLSNKNFLEAKKILPNQKFPMVSGKCLPFRNLYSFGWQTLPALSPGVPASLSVSDPVTS